MGKLLIQYRQAMLFLSVFALVDVYNNLPQYVINAKNDDHLQKMLMNITRKRSESAHADWAKSFCRRSGPDLNVHVQETLTEDNNVIT